MGKCGMWKLTALQSGCSHLIGSGVDESLRVSFNPLVILSMNTNPLRPEYLDSHELKCAPVHRHPLTYGSINQSVIYTFNGDESGGRVWFGEHGSNPRLSLLLCVSPSLSHTEVPRSHVDPLPTHTQSTHAHRGDGASPTRGKVLNLCTNTADE